MNSLLGVYKLLIDILRILMVPAVIFAGFILANILVLELAYNMCKTCVK